MPTEEVDLVVIGGGPTGLLSALLARRLGLSVSIIDGKSGPLDLGRADALNARTQQYLEVVGILDELLPQGLKCNTSSAYKNGAWTSRQNKWWVGIEHCLHKNFLMIGQPVVEKILTRCLAEETGTSVHYSEAAVAIAESDDGVVLTTNKGRTVHAKYAVGADGAHSTVRSFLGIKFEGTKPGMLWAVVDAFLDTDFPQCPEIITFELDEQSRVSWIPRERGMARFYVLVPGEVTLEKTQESIKRHLAPYRVDFKEIEWFSTFDVKERIASTFVTKEGRGRILLVGDAAHVHAINGGQGLNTGIADAFALSWRLAAAIKDPNLAPGAALKLVRSYDTERRAVAQGVIDVAAGLVRDTVNTAAEYVASVERNAGYITGMGVSYDSAGSELITDSEKGLWKAGKRCPEIFLAQPGNEKTVSIYSLIEYGNFLVLSIGGKGRGQPKARSNVVHFNLLPPGGNGTDSEDNVYTSEVIQPGDDFVVVVRPDTYIGYVGEGNSWEEYLAQIFVR